MILIEYFYYEPCHAHVQVDFVPGLLAHLPHGLAGNRGYALRGLVMRQSNFNPHKHLCQCHDCKHSDRLGVWLWCPSRNGLSQWQRSLKSYFKSRREDEMKPDMQRKHQGSSDLTCAQVRPMASWNRDIHGPSTPMSCVCMHSFTRVHPRSLAHGKSAFVTGMPNDRSFGDLQTLSRTHVCVVSKPKCAFKQTSCSLVLSVSNLSCWC